MPGAITNVREWIILLLSGKHPEQVTTSTTMKNGDMAEMLVIGAGFPRTGTSSLKTALERLGMKSYHMKNAMMMDSQLWYDHIQEKQNGKPGIYPKIMDEMAKQGYTATVDNPNILYYQELMERYPNAKVVMSVRVKGGGESYAESVLNTIGRFGPLLKRVPYKWIPHLQRIDALHDWHFAAHGSPVHPITKYPMYDDLVNTYDKWVETVPKTVPSEKLLIHKATDGWEPLCDFLSPLDPAIQRNCQQVLQNNEPYPYINDTAALRAVQDVFHWIAVVVENIPTFTVFGIIVWWMVVKAQPPKKGSAKSKKKKTQRVQQNDKNNNNKKTN